MSSCGPREFGLAWARSYDLTYATLWHYFGMLREVPAGQRELRQCEATAKLSVVSSVWTVLCTHGLDVLLS